MKILIACEYSGIVRDVFTAKGHNAWSCDLLPTESKGNHIQDDVIKHLNKGWDLMIAHPPCTFLSVSGACWMYNKDGSINTDRKKKQDDAIKELQKKFKVRRDMISVAVLFILIIKPRVFHVVHKFYHFSYFQYCL